MIYCKVCNLPIKNWGEDKSSNLFDASYHGGNWYKHRFCVTLIYPPILYHRRNVFFGDYDQSANVALKEVITLERFGARVLYFNTEKCQLIFPDDLPEKIYIYTGEAPLYLCGISGLRKDVMEKLPDTLELIPPPNHLFQYYFNNAFSPPKVKNIKGKIDQYPPLHPVFPVHKSRKRRRR